MVRVHNISDKALRLVLAFVLVVSFIPMTRSTAYADDSQGTSEDSANYVAGEMLVVFKDGANEASACKTLSALDAEVADGEDLGASLDKSTPVVVELDEGVSVEEAVAQANADPSIEYAQPNYIYTLPANEDKYSLDTYGVAGLTTSNASDPLEEYLSPCFVPNDPAVQNTTAAESGANAWQLANIGAFSAWDVAKTNDTVTVAILDTGCLMSHEDLTDRVWKEYAWNAYSSSTLTKDYNGHGTHVAGCVAATANNGLGTAGASYNAKVLPICVFDSAGEYCYTSTLVSAYDYLLDLMEQHPELNVHVVNMSLGGYGSLDSDDQLLEQRITTAKSKGVVTCAAGGNGDDYGNPKTAPSYPSDMENVIAVTALSTDGVSPTTWCDYNSNKDICAPGLYIYSTYATSNTTYKTLSGTSMATPIVCGCIALMFAANPNLTPDEVEAAIKETANPITVTSGREGKYGAGRINLAGAIEAVASIAITSTKLDADTGTTLQLECRNSTTGTPVWSVENGTGSATIDRNTGLLTALMPGTVTVTCSVPDVEKASASVTVTVNPLTLRNAPEATSQANGINVSWTGNVNAKGYIVERSVSPTGGFEQLADVENGVTSFLDTTAAFDAGYYYRVTPYSAVAKEGTGTPTQVVGGYRLSRVSTLASTDNESVNAKAFDSAAGYLSALGKKTSTAVLVAQGSTDAANAASVAGLEDALVVEVGSTFDSVVAAKLYNLGVSEIVLMASEGEISADVANSYANTVGATVTRYTDTTLQLSAAATVTAYAGEWGDTVAICNPADIDAVYECASYLYAAHIPVLFTNAGGKTFNTKAITAYAKFSKAIILGDSAHVGTTAITSLQRQGLTCTRVSLDGLSQTMGERAVSEGLMDYSYLSTIEPGSGFQTIGLASYAGLLGSPVIESAAEEGADQLTLLAENKDSVTASFVGGSEDYCATMVDYVEEALGCAAECKITEQPLNLVAALNESTSLSVQTSGRVVSYQWQTSVDGVAWENALGDSASATYAFDMDESLNGKYWRCVVTFRGEIVETSNVVTSKVSVKGDVNLNGRINIVDAQVVYLMATGFYGDKYVLLLEGFAAEGIEYTLSAVKAAADMNGDSVVDATDARAIQHYTHSA